MVSFLLVPRLKLWSEQSQGLTTGDLFSDRFDLKTGPVGGPCYRAQLVFVCWRSDHCRWKVITSDHDNGFEPRDCGVGSRYSGLHRNGRPQSGDLYRCFSDGGSFCRIVLLLVPLGLIKVGGLAAVIAHFEANPETESMVNWMALEQSN